MRMLKCEVSDSVSDKLPEMLEFEFEFVQN